jgi:hypothetical protein
VRLLLLLVCACGNGSNESPLTGDGAVDAPDEIDAFVAPITVTALDHYGSQPHLPLKNAIVQFVAPDGTVQTTSTNNFGVASAIAPPNTTVLLFQKGELNYPLVKVFVGANPGDEIAIGRYSREAFIDIGDVTFDLPAATDATNYKLSLSCGRRIGGFDRQLMMRVTDCAAHQTATAVGWAEAPGGVVIGGASVMTGLNLATLVGTTVTMPAYGATTSVSGSMVNVPATATDVSWNAFFYKNNDRMLVTWGGSTQASATVPVFDVGDRAVSALAFKLPGFERSYYYENHPSQVSSVTLDGAGMIRPFANLAYDKATNSVTWNEATVGQAPTIVSFHMMTHINGTTKMYLHLHAPYDPARKITLPQLPAELAIGANETVTLLGKFQAMAGKSYSDMLEIVDTSALVEHDPTFTGQLWMVR